MRFTVPAALAALSLALVSCNDTTTPLTQDQVDESVATTIAASGLDPNAETSGGHTAAPPTSTPNVTCTWNATTKWTTCTSTQNGLTVTRQMQFLNTAGIVLQFPDTSVRSMRATTTIVGTVTMTAPAPGGPTGTTTVNRTSDETVTGLARTSTQRVVNGTASGTEDSQGSDARGTMTVRRQYADTTKDMILSSSPTPLAPFPLSGTVIRNMNATVSVNGGTARAYTSREVRTFAAGGRVTIVTTINGQTRTCIVQLGSNTLPVCTQG